MLIHGRKEITKKRITSIKSCLYHIKVLRVLQGLGGNQFAYFSSDTIKYLTFDIHVFEVADLFRLLNCSLQTPHLKTSAGSAGEPTVWLISERNFDPNDRFIQGDQIGQIFGYWVFLSFGRIFENCRSKINIWATLFHDTRYILFLQKNGLGYILCDFFTNSSGHPGLNIQVHN
jgi:hypothetical protein